MNVVGTRLRAFAARLFMSHRTRRQLVVVLALCLVTAACFGDPPPDPDVAPLEVVVDSSQQPDQPCLLNRSEVGAGTHEVSVIAEGGAATVRILDSAGEVVFALASSASASGAASDATRLDVGSYTVECVPADGRVVRATLQVVPAT